ncbi:Secreted frizzled- protein 5 [Dermatophagoides farinae]|uniref:Frizzled-like protein n=1 Tax=Dermatophagoides farinae TaxID=6954 RepID=A0A922L8T9_DERFA|nr:frizzled-like protein [Dermatophagoides farinae]KAH9526839.1 Secreted frizzled- protein 5 [Dermatophagoides farinae]
MSTISTILTSSVIYRTRHVYSSLLIVLWLVVVNIDANTFIWDPNNTDNIDLVRPFNRHTTFANPPKCVHIPANLTLCHGIKYNEMRIPNLLYHETINEVIEQSSSWIQLIKIGCHPDTQLFLCSLFSPVCLDQTIPPCRSLCENVKQSCEPSMLIHGYSWPPMMQCNLFPIENNMCIESQQVTSGPSSSIRGNKQQTNKNDQSNNRTENEQFQRQLMNSICNSDWVIKIGLNQIRNNRVRVKKFKPLFGTLNVSPPFILTLNKSMMIGSTESTGTTGMPSIKPNREKFIVIGRGNNHAHDLSISLAVSWLKNTPQIKKAIRKVKSSNGCKKFMISTAQQSSTNVSLKTTNGQTKRNRNRNRKKNSNMARSH